jgi:hypothetical protein
MADRRHELVLELLEPLAFGHVSRDADESRPVLELAATYGDFHRKLRAVRAQCLPEPDPAVGRLEAREKLPDRARNHPRGVKAEFDGAGFVGHDDPEITRHEQDSVVRIVQHRIEVALGAAHGVVLTRGSGIGLRKLPTTDVLQSQPLNELQRSQDAEQERGSEDRQQQDEEALHRRLRGQVAGGELVALGGSELGEPRPHRVGTHSQGARDRLCRGQVTRCDRLDQPAVQLHAPIKEHRHSHDPFALNRVVSDQIAQTVELTLYPVDLGTKSGTVDGAVASDIVECPGAEP